jgi:hypothetical protein
MSEQPSTDNRPTTDQPVEPTEQPPAGGNASGEAAQGDGAPDSH